MVAKDEVEKFIDEEDLNIKTDGEKGDNKLKCLSCGMDNFVHTGGICKLDMWRLILTN